MTILEQISKLKARQIVLSNIMAASDAHAAKCVKLGLDFAKVYPEDLAAYTAAREEYNANEAALSSLDEALAREAEEEEARERGEAIEEAGNVE